MGTCDSNYRKKFEQVKVCSISLDNEFDKNGTQVFLREGNSKSDTTDFYDIIVPIQSIKDVTKGWEIKFSDR